ncbi:MAG: hypothetical protein IT462_17600 [Planctomycetes bacterium]|nr:hypothetical protein [Planctomycetota bacterium]
MIALFDILAKKNDEEGLIFVAVAVVIGVIIAVVSAAQKRKQAAGRTVRPPQRQTQRRQAPPQVVATPPAPPGHDSASEQSVARQLAPEMLTMMNARNLTPQVEKVAAPKFSLATMLKNRTDVRRALILNEVLSKPLSLRRK